MITHLSASSIDDYMRCPRLFYNTRIKKLPVAPTPEMVIGTLVHEYLAFGTEPTSDDPGVVATALALGDAYKQNYDSLPANTVYELPFLLDFADLQIKGAIDAVVDNTAVYERKTTGSEIDLFCEIKRRSRQPPLYLLAARSLGYPVSHVVLDVMQRPKTFKVYKNESQEQAVARIQGACKFHRESLYYSDRDLENFLDDLDGVRKMIQTGVFPRNPNSCFMYGKNCTFIGECWK